MDQFLNWIQACNIDPNSAMGQFAKEAWMASRRVLIEPDNLEELEPPKRYMGHGQLIHPESDQEMEFDVFTVNSGLTRIEMQRTRQALTFKSFDHIVALFVESGLIEPIPEATSTAKEEPVEVDTGEIDEGDNDEVVSD